VDARETVRVIFDEAVKAGDVHTLLPGAVGRSDHRLTVQGRAFDLEAIRRLLVVGGGKASGAMAEALEALLADRISDGVVVVKAGDPSRTRRVRLVPAGHPIPDHAGLEGAREVLALAESGTAQDLIICLLSGGGSALLPAPVPAITFGEKREVTRLLLEAGATIQELNVVRKHLSTLKGGQLARAAAPAPLLTLILSDVIGDPLDVIASGPTVPDPSTFAEAIEILKRYRLIERTPPMVLAHLNRGVEGKLPETPKPSDPIFGGVTNRVIGNNTLLVDRAMETARARGLTPVLHAAGIQGEAREVARGLVAAARAIRDRSDPGASPVCLVAAGETTVTVRGDGVGGRCQEFCLAAAIEVAGEPGITVLAAGSDGSDGPTDAAGAIADGTTVTRAETLGLDAQAFLERNDSHEFFSRLGDLIITGATRTNLMDLYLILITGTIAH
jgi:hydroxypyruvate reductase